MSLKVLYIVTKPGYSPLMCESSPGKQTSVILAQDAVTFSGYSVASVYALTEDAEKRNVTPSVPTISYRDLVELVFDADHVVAV